MFHDNNSGAWLARRAWHARSMIFAALLALQASVREARPVSRVRRSVPASTTANHALSTDTLHSCRSFWSWTTFRFRGRWNAWRGMEQRRRSRFRLAVACVVARPSLLLRHAASSMLKQRWWIKCALARACKSFTPSNRSREKKTLLAIRALSTTIPLTVDFVLDRTRKLTLALAFKVSWCAMHVVEVRLWSRVWPAPTGSVDTSWCGHVRMSQRLTTSRTAQSCARTRCLSMVMMVSGALYEFCRC